MSPLEKMARALCTCDEQDGGGPWGFHSPAYQEGYRDRARAALLAIRDMPASMVEAAAVHVFGPEPLPHEVSNFDNGWEAVIDAILNQEPRP